MVRRSVDSAACPGGELCRRRREDAQRPERSTGDGALRPPPDGGVAGRNRPHEAPRLPGSGGYRAASEGARRDCRRFLAARARGKAQHPRCVRAPPRCSRRNRASRAGAPVAPGPVWPGAGVGGTECRLLDGSRVSARGHDVELRRSAHRRRLCCRCRSGRRASRASRGRGGAGPSGTAAAEHSPAARASSHGQVVGEHRVHAGGALSGRRSRRFGDQSDGV